ncbi:MAG TPA: hypothetical protein VGK73_35020, partial [Polyangiaceae bacterium]
MRDLRTITGLVLLFVVAGACSDDGKKRRKNDDCDIGDTKTCTCPDDSIGIKECDEEEEEWGDCQCGFSPDSGGTGGTGGTFARGGTGTGGTGGTFGKGGTGTGGTGGTFSTGGTGGTFSTGGSSGSFGGSVGGSAGSGGSVTPASTCDTICDFQSSCHGVTGCNTPCEDWYLTGSSSCIVTLDSWASCVRSYGPTCSTVDSICTSYESSVASYCEAPPDENSCIYAYNGSCEEGDLCAYGTDTFDCSAPICATADDGICDERLTCDLGADTGDCGRCSYQNDGICDED